MDETVDVFLGMRLASARTSHRLGVFERREALMHQCAIRYVTQRSVQVEASESIGPLCQSTYIEGNRGRCSSSNSLDMNQHSNLRLL